MLLCRVDQGLLGWSCRIDVILELGSPRFESHATRISLSSPWGCAQMRRIWVLLNQFEKAAYQYNNKNAFANASVMVSCFQIKHESTKPRLYIVPFSLVFSIWLSMISSRCFVTFKYRGQELNLQLSPNAISQINAPYLSTFWKYKKKWSDSSLSENLLT